MYSYTLCILGGRMFYRLISILILFFSTSYAADKLDPGYEIPGHVQFLLRVYQAIDQENKEVINPEAFDRADLHHSLTLFFDPNWGDKTIPTTLQGLDAHYGKIRKILVYPYWAHKKCLEVLDIFQWDGHYPSAWDVNIEQKPLIMMDPVTHECFQHENLLKILLTLSTLQEKKTPWQPLIREDLPLDIALPTEIENPLFLMALARSLQYFPSTMLELINEYQSGEVEREQFAQTFKTKMMDKKDSEPFSKFGYILWYINHYDVFGEKVSS